MSHVMPSVHVIVYRIDNKGKASFHSKQQLDIYSDGYAVEISHFGSGLLYRNNSGGCTGARVSTDSAVVNKLLRQA